MPSFSPTSLRDAVINEGIYGNKSGSASMFCLPLLRRAIAPLLATIFFDFHRKVSVKVHTRTHRLFLALSLIFCMPFVSHCALFGGGSETLHRAKGYKVQPPPGWTATSSNQESDSAFQTPNGNIATVTSSCQRNANASLDVLTRHLLLGARNTVFLKKENIFVADREGQRSSVKTTLDGNTIFLELFVLPKEACVFDFSLVSNKSISEKERAEFNSFFKSFTYGSN